MSKNFDGLVKYDAEEIIDVGNRALEGVRKEFRNLKNERRERLIRRYLGTGFWWFKIKTREQAERKADAYIYSSMELLMQDSEDQEYKDRIEACKKAIKLGESSVDGHVYLNHAIIEVLSDYFERTDETAQ